MTVSCIDFQLDSGSLILSSDIRREFSRLAVRATFFGLLGRPLLINAFANQFPGFLNREISNRFETPLVQDLYGKIQVIPIDDVQNLSHNWVGLAAPNLADLEVAKRNQASRRAPPWQTIHRVR